MDPIEVEQYVESLFPVDTELEKVKEAIRQLDMPEIWVAPGYGRLLTFLVKCAGASRVLEIGALGGYSGICLCRGLPQDGKLISLELKNEYAELAHKHLRECGFGDQVEYRVGEALNSLEQLAEEGAAFDFFFIDADKGNYPNYLEWAIKLANPGAIIIGDNTLLHGKVLKHESKSNSAVKMREFNQIMAQDPRLEGILLPAYDGFAVARVK